MSDEVNKNVFDDVDTDQWPTPDQMSDPEPLVEPESNEEQDVVNEVDETEQAPEQAPEPLEGDKGDKGDKPQWKDVDPHTVHRMAELLRKRNNNSITQFKAYDLLITDEKLFWEIYNMRTWH